MPYDQTDVVSALLESSDNGRLIESQIDAIRYGVRSAFEFYHLLDQIDTDDPLAKSAEQIEERIRTVMRVVDPSRPHFGLRDAAEDLLHDTRGLFDEVEYGNDGIASGAGSLFDLRQFAEELAASKLRTPLRWQPYPSALHLKAEYAGHFARLRSEESSREARIKALLQTARLQLVFLANTFCPHDDA